MADGLLKQHQNVIAFRKQYGSVRGVFEMLEFEILVSTFPFDRCGLVF